MNLNLKSYWRANITAVLDGTEDDMVQDKLVRAAEERLTPTQLAAFDVEHMLDLVKQNPVLATFLCKPPKKQSGGEKEMIKALKRIPGVSNVQKLKQSGPKSLTVLGGAVITGKIKKGMSAQAQANVPSALDVSFDYGNDSYYATLKATEGQGGSQTNAFKDVVTTLTEGAGVRSHGSKRVRVIAIVEGNYYTHERRQKLGPLASKLSSLPSDLKRISKIL